MKFEFKTEMVESDHEVVIVSPLSSFIVVMEKNCQDNKIVMIAKTEHGFNPSQI